MRRVCPILAALACALPALAQSSRFSFGAIGGVRLSSGAPNATDDESPRYTIGADFEASLGDHFAVEADALYKRFGSSYIEYLLSFDNFATSPGGTASDSSSEDLAVERLRANSLEFPVLGKYYFGRRNSQGRFFVATGYSFQRSWVTSTTGIEELSCCVYVGSFDLPEPPIEVGVVFGAGWARRVGPFIFSPAFRYTRWGARFDAASLNQMEILVSLRR